MKNKDMCYLVDSGMNITTIKQDVIQELIDNKTIGRLDIIEQVGCEDILDLIDELLIKFKLWNKYDMGYICEHLQDIICEMEILESENIENE
jgi:hypothetical protein